MYSLRPVAPSEGWITERIPESLTYFTAWEEVISENCLTGYS